MSLSNQAASYTLQEMRKDGLSILMGRLGRRYAGQYVGVIDGRVVSSGRNQLQVFKKAEKVAPKHKEIGILYIPSKTDVPLLLKIR